MSVTDVIRGIQQCQVAYHNHTTGNAQSNTIPEWMHFMSLGQSRHRDETAAILAAVEALRVEVAALREGK